MTSCPACKSPNADARNFCGACGAPIARFCSVCGFKNLLPDRFCGGCGINLAEGLRPRADSALPPPAPSPAKPELLADPLLTDLPLGAEDELLALANESAVAPAEPEDTKVSQDDIDSLFGV